MAEVLGALPGLADVPVMGVVPWDPATAQAWTFGAHRPGRSGLLRACEELGRSPRPDVEVGLDLDDDPRLGRGGQRAGRLPVPFRVEQGGQLLGGDGVPAGGDGVRARGGPEGSGS